jgi:hypothetical protein
MNTKTTKSKILWKQKEFINDETTCDVTLYNEKDMCNTKNDIQQWYNPVPKGIILKLLEILNKCLKDFLQKAMQFTIRCEDFKGVWTNA